jgi:hypothetical protein
MIERLITGGQTGADQAVLRAARAAGIPTGGWAPAGWMTETGPAPWLADYGLAEHPEPGYTARTRANVRDSDATLWFGSWTTPGGRATLDACQFQGKPSLVVFPGATRSAQIRGWIVEHGVRILNVAGNRESTALGIGDEVERFMARVFRRLAGGH